LVFMAASVCNILHLCLHLAPPLLFREEAPTFLAFREITYSCAQWQVLGNTLDESLGNDKHVMAEPPTTMIIMYIISTVLFICFWGPIGHTD